MNRLTLLFKEVLFSKAAYDFLDMNLKQKDTLIIVILLFVFVLVWIGESIYQSTTGSTISEDVSKEILPIAPAFDTKTIDNLKSREKIIPAYEFTNVVPTPIALPKLSPSPKASEAGELLLK
jgi:hypothetical protein